MLPHVGFFVFCKISIETVRRDLEHLEKEGYLKRVHRGAVLEEINGKELNFTERETKFIDKIQIV